MASKVLVVDDDPAFRKMIKKYLETHHFSVVDADNGSDAILFAREVRPDLVLSDAEMPGLDGHSLCRVLKQDPALKTIPILLMSGSRIQDQNILAGLEGGADDYLLKPFSMLVLVAKIQAALRRRENSTDMTGKLKESGFEFDPVGRSVKIDGKPVSLTRKEFDLLALLVSKPGHVMSFSYLLEAVWGYDLADYNDSSTIDVHVSHLRKKLGPSVAKRIVNLKGVGYKFEA
jgi:DNA-binding response OmpR family regulator